MYKNYREKCEEENKNLQKENLDLSFEIIGIISTASINGEKCVYFFDKNNFNEKFCFENCTRRMKCSIQKLIKNLYQTKLENVETIKKNNRFIERDKLME